MVDFHFFALRKLFFFSVKTYLPVLECTDSVMFLCRHDYTASAGLTEHSKKYSFFSFRTTDPKLSQSDLSIEFP